MGIVRGILSLSVYQQSVEGEILQGRDWESREESEQFPHGHVYQHWRYFKHTFAKLKGL